MTFEVRVASMGRMPLPGPEVFWMAAWDEWFEATFWMTVIRRGADIILVNTGAPDDLRELNDLWRASHPSGRSQFVRNAREGFRAALDRLDIAPSDVTHVILTPIVAYTLGNLRALPNAQIVMSRRGWIEDVLAPPLPRHVPRHIFVPDDMLVWLLTEANDRITLVDGAHDLLPGLRAWECGVHHRSSMVVEVDTSDGIVAITDAAFAYRNVEENIHLGIGESYAEAMTTYARLRENASILIPLYDSAVRDRHPGGVVSG